MQHDTVSRFTDKPRRIAFISSNVTWGGSEELWSAAAAELAGDGHKVTAYKNRLERGTSNVEQLRKCGCSLVELAKLPFLPVKVFSLLSLLMSYPINFGYQTILLYLHLLCRKRPDLVIISQGCNQDGWHFGAVCRRLGLSYVLISQKASEFYWPADKRVSRIRAVYNAAHHAFFVSEHNRTLTEEQLGCALERSSVVRNPFMVPWVRQGAWPKSEEGFRFACVGRLYPMEKGQDLVLRVLSQEKWRTRPVHLSFFGSGEQRLGLERMAKYLRLENVSFAGHVSDVVGIWSTHHCLVLPSRAEGLPLVLVEAMLSGRVPIVTDVAGNAEIVDDGATGFLAAAATEEALDEAMERAWRRRHDWQSIGENAASRIRTMVPPDPIRTLCGLLLRSAAGESIPADRKTLDRSFSRLSVRPDACELVSAV